MKKFLVPTLLVLFAAGLGQRESKAGGFSIGISIGDNHRYAAPPVVLAPPPMVISRPPVIVAQAPVCVPQPPVVVVQTAPQICEPSYGYTVVREYSRPGWRGHSYRNARYEHDRSYSHEHRR
jgi:hypothetical protein